MLLISILLIVNRIYRLWLTFKALIWYRIALFGQPLLAGTVDNSNIGEAVFNQAIIRLAENIINDQAEITQDRAFEMAAADADDTMDLIACAGKIRQHFMKRSAFKCAIINAKSGRCPEDCAFCAQSVHHHTHAQTYDLLSEAVLEETGREMAMAGATNYSIVTSGTALTDKQIDTVCRVARRLKKKTDLTLCASVGLLTNEGAAKLKAAGISRYHHNLETARSHFDAICTTHDYDDDIETVQRAKRAGMVVCSGGIFGMGESWAQRVELAFTLKELDVDSVPINFLNPIKGTRLEDRTLLPPMEALKVIALYRFIFPKKDITICGGREATLKDFQSWVFAAGANGLMVGNYLTTQGRNLEDDFEMIADLGMNDH
jgi:biotin synthase